MKLKHMYANGFYAKNFPVRLFGLVAMRNSRGDFVSNIPWNACNNFHTVGNNPEFNLISWCWGSRNRGRIELNYGDYDVIAGEQEFAMNILHHVLDIMDREGKDVGKRDAVQCAVGTTYQFAWDERTDFADEFLAAADPRSILSVSWETLKEYFELHR